MNGVIETATGDLIRAGGCDFDVVDGEEFRDDVPSPFQVRGCCPYGTVHRWTGDEWIVVGEQLAHAQVRREADLGQATTTYIYSRYTPPNQQTFTMLLSEARFAELTNRVAYIEPLIEWIDTVLEYHYQTIDAISDCTTVAEVNAVTWDHDGTFTSTDPLLSIRQAYVITT